MHGGDPTDLPCVYGPDSERSFFADLVRSSVARMDPDRSQEELSDRLIEYSAVQYSRGEKTIEEHESAVEAYLTTAVHDSWAAASSAAVAGMGLSGELR
jgi:hypothetical protein